MTALAPRAETTESVAADPPPPRDTASAVALSAAVPGDDQSRAVVAVAGVTTTRDAEWALFHGSEAGLTRALEAGEVRLVRVEDRDGFARANHDDEAGDSFASVASLERSIRTGFARKVTGLVAVLVGVVLAVVSLFVWTPAIRDAAAPYAPDGKRNPSAVGVLLATGVVMVVVVMASSCACSVRATRRFPHSVLLPIAVAASMGAFLGVWSVWLQNNALVYVGFGGALAVTLALVAFACQTRHDFGGPGPYLVAGGVVLVVVGLAGGLGGARLALLWVALALVVFSAYVVHDVQVILRGKHRRFEFGVDDAPLAALAVLTDFVALFAVALGLSAVVGQ